MAKIIRTNGKMEDLTDVSLESLQAGVGGWIEIVRLPNGQDMVVNEEGLIHGLPQNLTASRLAGQPLVGDCILCKRGELNKDEEGGDT